MIVFGAGKSTVRLSNCQIIHMHISSSARMPGNNRHVLSLYLCCTELNKTQSYSKHTDGRKREIKVKKRNQTLRMIYIKIAVAVVVFGIFIWGDT